MTAPRRPFTWLGLLLLWPALQAAAQEGAGAAPERAAERARITRERAAIVQQQAQDEAQCQQRFAVEDCLRRVRRQAEKQEAARRRLQEHEARKARDAARGHPPAAPLPQPQP